MERKITDLGAYNNGFGGLHQTASATTQYFFFLLLFPQFFSSGDSGPCDHLTGVTSLAYFWGNLTCDEKLLWPLTGVTRDTTLHA